MSSTPSKKTVHFLSLGCPKNRVDSEVMLGHMSADGYVHSDNPEKFGMEHLLEWYLIYRDEAGMSSILPENSHAHRLYVDETGVNVFAEAAIR